VLNAVKKESLFLGSLVKPFGLHGEMKFVGSDDFWPGVFESGQLELLHEEDGKVISVPVRIEKARPHGGNFVIKLEHIVDRTGAELEVGGELFIDPDHIDVELPDEELPFQVVGTVVKLEDGTTLGTVTSVIFSAAHGVYEVKGDSGVVLIPAVDEFIVGRDYDSGVITVRPIPGLVEP